MRITRVVLVLALAAVAPVAPSSASPECQLFLLAGPYNGPHDDPAFYGCTPFMPGGPRDTSILLPTSLGAFGYVRASASSSPPTHGSITVQTVDGGEWRTPITFRWVEFSSGYDGYWLTDEYVNLGPTATRVVIVARFGGRLHRHEYSRLIRVGG